MKKCADTYMQPQRDSRQQLQMENDPDYYSGHLINATGLSVGDVVFRKWQITLCISLK